MKQLLFYLLYFTSIPFSANAQQDLQISIQTEQGIITVSKAADGKDMIIMSLACWDEIVAGTKYCSYHLTATKGQKACLQITDKKQGNCKKGIGFGCSIFDCPSVPDSSPNRVDNENRTCAVTIKKGKSSVNIIFDDKVDWHSLQNLQQCN